MDRAARYREAHREELAQKAREYRQNNKEKRRIKRRKDYLRNKEREAETTKKWREEHPERVSIWRSSRRAKELEAQAFDFTAEQLAGRLDYFGRKCYLKLEGCTGEYQHLDHVIPLSRGGLHALPNLRPACQSCNLRKGNKLLEELV